ncbi:MAG: TIGR03618 family F420-dependent PPOX class oxidoreductase [Dehalococcoidia bacterium]
MTNQRSRIQLTGEEQRALIASARTLQVASLSPGGWPHLVPMWFGVDEEGLIVFTTYGTSQKVRNLERDPRITVLVETGETYDELRGVSIEGRAEIVRNPWVTAHTGALVSAQRAGAPRPPLPDRSQAPRATKRVTIRVHPERTRSWDHRKIG